MQVQYLGHSSFLIESGGFKILLDPFISPNPLNEGKIDVNKIDADYILVSHGHEDHTADVEAIAKRTEATIISNWEIINYYAKKGLEKGHPMNIGGRATFDFGIVKMVNAIHSSSFPDGTYAGNPAGFVIEFADHTIYYSGDTALHEDMRQIGAEYNKIDAAFLCLGDNFTMDVQDAMLAAEYIGCKKVVAMHYDTFPYIEIDQIVADQIARKHGVDLIFLSLDETYKF